MTALDISLLKGAAESDAAYNYNCGDCVIELANFTFKLICKNFIRLMMWQLDIELISN
jgi:hypothetical protein